MTPPDLAARVAALLDAGDPGHVRDLKVDGANVMTDKGGVCLQPFRYADGGKGRPVGTEDWRAMRTLFCAAPELLAACEAVLGWLRAPPEIRDLAGGPGGENAALLLEGAVARARGG